MHHDAFNFIFDFNPDIEDPNYSCAKKKIVLHEVRSRAARARV